MGYYGKIEELGDHGLRREMAVCEICNQASPNELLEVYSEDDDTIHTVHYECMDEVMRDPILELMERVFGTSFSDEPVVPVDITGLDPESFRDGLTVLIPPEIDLSKSVPEIEIQAEEIYKVEERTEGEWFLSIFSFSDDGPELVLNYDWFEINRAEWREQQSEQSKS